MKTMNYTPAAFRSLSNGIDNSTFIRVSIKFRKYPPHPLLKLDTDIYISISAHKPHGYTLTTSAACSEA